MISKMYDGKPKYMTSKNLFMMENRINLVENDKKSDQLSTCQEYEFSH